ncbi:aldehyde dehydrogenase family protein [Gudongella sp. DL1XJH-153]|uniref:aldehyde dehydrogenase family protein n=2 Tax=Bacillota TaxID=1239 RepID=UPI003BB736BE
MTELQKYNNYIDGKWVKPTSGKYFKNINPADYDDVIGEFPLSSGVDGKAAVDSASEAFNTWSKMLPKDREVYLNRFVDMLEDNVQRIGEAICREEGKTLKDAISEPEKSIRECSFMIGEGRRLEGITMPSDRNGVESVAKRVPIGVVTAISPWNFPFITPLRKIISALVTGNTVVFKPSSDTPHTGVIIMELFHGAGFPPGVVNMVIGKGDDLGDSIVSDPLVKGITFTGSTDVGKKINRKASNNFTKLQFEMGGKNPAIVADYKDIPHAAREITDAAFSLTGQRCTSISRLVVLREHEEELVSSIVENMKDIVVGNGKDPSVYYGPMINEAAGKKCMEYIESAREENAKILVGGNRLTGGEYDKGFYIEPTLIVNADNEMKVSREEIFGPVLVVIAVESFDEAIEISNRTKYGLSSVLFTDNLDYIGRFSGEVEAGMLHINHGTVTDPFMPFGGIKDSGLGEYSKGSTNKTFFTNWKVTYTKYTR